jgi:O-antigen ligase
MPKVSKLHETVEKKEERINIGSGHFALYLTAFDVWKDSVLIGGGIKSFRINCAKKSKGDPSKYQTNRYCDAHPHHYYLEILTDTGLIGLMLLLLILYQLLIKKLFIIRKMNNTNKIIFISLIICLAVELFPLRSSGSFFSTANASYIFILIGLISKFNENEKA